MLESRQVAWPAYLVAIAIILIPLADVSTSLYPWRLMEARWRFGAVGLMSNALLLPMPGLLLAYVTATILDHRRTRRVIGILGLAAAVLCVIALGVFGLDAIQTRAGVRPELRLSFNVASVSAAVKTIIAGAAFLAIGIASFRGRRPTGEVKRASSPLIPVDPAPVKP